jgi:hypothetical protein
MGSMVCPDCLGPKALGAIRCRVCVRPFVSASQRDRWAAASPEQRERWTRGVRERNRVAPTQRKYHLDEEYFDNVTTPDKAYWLGFLAGDGCIVRGALVVALAPRDRGHLELLRLAVGSDAPIRDSTANSALRLSSIRLVAALSRLGVGPRKSLTLDPWVGPDDLMRHYWRGLMDADGTIEMPSSGGISLVGTRAVTQAFGDWGRTISPDVRGNAYAHKNIWRVSFGGRVSARDILMVLYDDAPTALARKRLRAQVLIDAGPSRQRTPETRAKIAATLKGRAPSQANRDAHGTPKARERARQRMLGRTASDETRRKMSESHRRLAEGRK